MKFFYGEESYLINQEIAKAAQAFGVEPIVFSEDDSLESIIMDINTVSMFFAQKLVVVRNHHVIGDERAGKQLIGEIKDLDDTIMAIFVLDSPKLPQSPLIDFLRTNGEIKEFKRLAPVNVVAAIRDIVANKGASITSAAAIKLADKVPNDLRLIINEIEKLIAQNPHITEQMVENAIGDYLKEDVYAFVNAIANHDVHALLFAYCQHKKMHEEPTHIIGQISSMLLLALQVGAFRRQGYSNQDISNKTKIHVFRIKKATELVAKTSIENIKSLIVKLSQLDLDIKIGKVDAQLGLDSFVLDLIR